MLPMHADKITEFQTDRSQSINLVMNGDELDRALIIQLIHREKMGLGGINIGVSEQDVVERIKIEKAFASF